MEGARGDREELMGANISYYPESSGLEIVASIDEDGLCYEFNTLIVWRHIQTGRLFWAQDSGCSCPIPFEDYYFDSPDTTNLEEINRSQFENFEREVNGFPAKQEERGDIIDTVKKLVMK